MEIPKRLAVFEDDPRNLLFLKTLLPNLGYQIVAEAVNMTQAVPLAHRLVELNAPVSLVDGVLTPFEDESNDGAKICSIIHSLKDGLLVVGYYNYHPVRGADYQVAKKEGPERLLAVLAQAFSALGQ